MTVIYQPKQIDDVVEILSRGEPVALPTETVYGLAAPALAEKSLAKIFSLKARPHFDPLIVHVSSTDEAARYAAKFSELELKLMETFWPGPLTLLVEKKALVPDLCTSSSALVALRSPAHPLFQQVLRLLAQPLAAPSANRFGRVSPTEAQAVVEELGPYGLEGVLDGGVCERGVESTLLRVLPDRRIEVRRPGALSLEEIEKRLSQKIEWVFPVKKYVEDLSPGLLDSHYSPQTPLRYFDLSDLNLEKLRAASPQTALLISYSEQKFDKDFSASIFYLSESGNEIEAAAKLFSQLRALDRVRFKEIWAFGGPEKGLFRAVNDRLRRAGGKRPSHSTISI